MLPAESYILMAFASDGLEMVQSVSTDMALSANEEPGNELFEAEPRRSRNVVRKSARHSYMRHLTT